MCVRKGNVSLLYHLIRLGEQVHRNCQTNQLCRLKVNDQLKLCRLLYWQIGRLRSLENLVDVAGSLAVLVIVIHPVRHEATIGDKLLLEINSGESIFAGELD